ncbi:MAG TPA: ANTAR domain-containing protein [Pseudonocardia sp.]|jgi:hypothetical protein
MPTPPLGPARIGRPAEPGRPHGLADLTGLALEIASAPVTDRDPAALLYQVCVELTRRLALTGCAGLLLDPSTGAVGSLVASHPEAGQLARLLEQPGNGDPPRPVVDLSSVTSGGLAEAAARVGMPLSATVELHSSARTVGRLRLFADRPDALPAALLAALAPLAGVLGAAVANAEAYQHSADLVARLSAALGNQGPVEQAKGLLAERHGIDLDRAYRMLREQARLRGVTVTEVAADEVNRSWRAAGQAAEPEQPDPTTPLPEQRGADTVETPHRATG